MPTQLYLSANARSVVVAEGEHYRINPQPGTHYERIEYRLLDTQATLEFGAASLGLNARITLPESEDYRFSFNALSGQVDITLADGHVLARLPVDNEGTTAPIRLGDNDETALHVDPETLSVTPTAEELAGLPADPVPEDPAPEDPVPEDPAPEDPEPPQDGTFISANNNSEPLPWTLLFMASAPTDIYHDRQLYVSDGTAAGTYMPFPAARYMSLWDTPQLAADNIIYLQGEVADTNWNYQSGWFTLNLATQRHEYLGSDYDYYGEHGNSRDHDELFNGDFSYIARDSGPYGRELYRRDDDENGATTHTLIKDINPGSNSGLSSFSDAALLPNGTLLFAANDGSSSWDEPWASDGTQAGTFALADTGEWDYIRYRGQFTALGDEVAFSAFINRNAEDGAPYYGNQLFGTELVFSDGTLEGTRVMDIYQGSSSSNPQILGATHNALYFTADNPGGRGIYRTDGDSFTLLADIVNDAQLLGWSNNIAYFNVATREYGNELWAADLTGDDGFYLVKDILPGSGASLATYNGDATMLDDRIVFTAYTSDTEQSLMVSDGSDEGTRIITTFDGTAPYDTLLAANGTQVLYFSGDSVVAHDVADHSTQWLLDDIQQWQMVGDGEAIYATRPLSDNELQLWLIDAETADVTLVGGIDGHIDLYNAVATATSSIA